MQGESSLIVAARCGDLPTFRRLLGTPGCNLDATDSNQRTALHVACAFGRLEMVQLLLQAGSNADSCSVSGQTPLHEACIGGHYSVLQQLMSEVSDLDAVDANGLSAAHYCALNAEVDCLTLLCNQVHVAMTRQGWRIYSRICNHSFL